MPQLPEGDPAPPTGQLPASALTHLPRRPLAVYVHVPFCRVRCGYCDFNTYTLGELGSERSPATYVDSAQRELALADRVLGPDVPPVDTVFFGGGTPTMLPAADLTGLLRGIRETFGLAPGAEVTTEANPDSVDAAYLETLRENGFTRVSFGMQSAVPHVLATLDRTHDPANVERAVAAAGYGWYEISNWARTPTDRCRHNLHYWSGANWWGIGPGAHSHVGGVRWWNVKHPSAYAARLASGDSPAAARETLTVEQQDDERVLLGIRLANGLPIDGVGAQARLRVGELIGDGLVDGQLALTDRRLVLTRRGRLLADTVVHALLAT